MIVDRIKQIIEYKQISTRQFCLKIGVSNGFFDKVRDIGSEKASKILKIFPEISPDWLLLEKGEMLRNNANSTSVSQSITGNDNNMAGKDIKIVNSDALQLNEYKIRINEQSEQINNLLSEQKNLHNQIDKLIDKLK
jgi:hypothetical protein